MNQPWVNLLLGILPELTLLLTGAVMVMLLVAGRAAERRAWPGRAALAGVLLAMVLLAAGPRVTDDDLPRRALPTVVGQVELSLPPVVTFDHTTNGARWAALLMGLLLVAGNFALPQSRPTVRPGDHPGAEYFMLLLFSLAGLMLTAMANDLIVLFLAIELSSVPTFAAIALSRPWVTATEAAGKYFFLSAFSITLLLMGLAFLYGLAGQTNLSLLDGRPAGAGLSSFALIGMGFVLAALAFKLAAFPYHVYVADVYQGSAAPLAGWLAFVPKAAALLALARLLTAVGGWPGPADAAWLAEPAFAWTLWALAAATMTVGNVLALWQSSVKRMLAYSSVAHSGYLLVALMTVPARPGWALPPVVLFYLVAYGLATLGAFLVISTVRLAEPGGDREADRFDELHGLARRHPVSAVAMAVFGFALMGLPLTAGFWAKVYVFIDAYRSGLRWLVVVALVNAAVGAAYYLRMIAACWRDRTHAPAEPPAEPTEPPAGALVGSPHRAARVVIVLLAAITLLFGLAPRVLTDRLERDSRGRWVRWPNPSADPAEIDEPADAAATAKPAELDEPADTAASADASATAGPGSPGGR